MLHVEESKRAVLTDEEQAVMDHIGAAMDTIVNAWGLHMGNNLEMELCLHVHGLQGFVVQHMLQRVEPNKWGKWYK